MLATSAMTVGENALAVLALAVCAPEACPVCAAPRGEADALDGPSTFALALSTGAPNCFKSVRSSPSASALA